VNRTTSRIGFAAVAAALAVLATACAVEGNAPALRTRLTSEGDPARPVASTTYQLGDTIGVPDVDRILEAVSGGRAQQLAAWLRWRSIACAAGEAPGAASCVDGEHAGDLVPAFRATGCAPVYLRPSTAGEALAVLNHSAGTFVVAKPENQAIEGVTGPVDYAITITPSDGTPAQTIYLSSVLGITDLRLGCASRTSAG
jgi:hypothetical protein